MASAVEPGTVGRSTGRARLIRGRNAPRDERVPPPQCLPDSGALRSLVWILEEHLPATLLRRYARLMHSDEIPSTWAVW
jgi:hypothetical protein